MLEKIKKNSINKLISKLDTENHNDVIFWDTCSLLDIIRLPYRTNSVQYLDFYQQIYSLIKDKKVISVASELTIAELNYNIPNVEKEYDNYLKKLQQDFKCHEDYLIKCNKIVDPIINFTLEQKELKQSLFKLLDEIILHTIFLTENLNYNKFAHFRVSYHMAPAKKKGEYKDCYIWATCLELAKQSSSHDINILFFTKNKEDFFEYGKLFELIQNDCSSTTITVVLEIGHLLGLIVKKNAP
jgi:hypothetical protein